MNRRMFLSSAALIACTTIARPAFADDKNAPTGTWMKSGGELRIEFADKELKISPHNKDEVILVVCKMSLDKDGVVKAKISELQGSAKEKAQGVLPVGTEFTFKWQAKDGEATLDDFKGENIETLRSHLEGKYEKK
jgi:hypothetical protein